MPQIFQEETLSMVWDMITVENMKMRKVSEILCCTYDKVNVPGSLQKMGQQPAH